ncbi:MAG: T9SS type A sorting domain-containing protein [Bacteroidia bacterium]
MKHIFIFCCITFLTVQSAVACSCFPIGQNFCETLQNDPSIDNVVMVEKIADYYYGMRVRRLSLIGGNLVPDTFLVWGDNGALCRIGVTNFSNGDTLILALNRCDTLGNFIWNQSFPPDLESTSDYHVSVCGYYALRVINGQVAGDINTPFYQTMSMQTFLSLSCLLLSTHETNLPTWNIFPNPATNTITISGEQQITHLAIYSMTGQLVLSRNIALASYQIDLSGLDVGYYIIEIQTADFVSRKELVVSR